MDNFQKVSTIMTTKVIIVSPKDTMERVSDIFRKNNIHHIPVIEKGKVVGIVSKTDFHKIEHHFTLFKNKRSEEINSALMRSLLVEDVMTKQVAKIYPDDSISFAAGIFKENLFHALPVVDADNQLLGIITTFDLINYAFKDVIFLESDKV